MAKKVKNPEGIKSSIHDPTRWERDYDEKLFESEVRLSKMRAETVLMLTRGIQKVTNAMTGEL